MMNFEREFCYFRLTSIRFRGPDQLIKVISSPEKTDAADTREKILADNDADV
jgi:hypothetical protein